MCTANSKAVTKVVKKKEMSTTQTIIDMLTRKKITSGKMLNKGREGTIRMEDEKTHRNQM